MRPQAMLRTFTTPSLALFLFAVPFLACGEEAAPAPSAAKATSVTTKRPALTRVASSSLVCMVNDRYMGTEQIPVNVDGKTYYGCCAACKDKLQNSASARTAADPVTGASVDKAAAVVAKTETGKVLYFESEQSLARYVAPE